MIATISEATPAALGVHPSGMESVFEESAGGRENRQCPRRGMRCPVQVFMPGAEGADGSTTIAAQCLNISDGGMYAFVERGQSVAMGKRHLFHIRLRERGPEGQQTVVQQGIVVRTELLLSDDGQRLGIGVRFCGHRSGVIPMPFHVHEASLASAYGPA